MIKKGKHLLTILFTLGIFFGSMITASALFEYSEYITLDPIVLDEEAIPNIRFSPPNPDGIPVINDEDLVSTQYEVVLLTKEKYDEIKALEQVYLDTLADTDATPAEKADALAALEDAIDAECVNAEDAPGGRYTVRTEDMNWVDCEQTSYVLLIYTLIDIDQSLQYNGYRLEEMKNPEVCSAENTPGTPETTDNPKTGIANPYLLGGISSTVAATGLLISRKKRYI